MSELRLRPHKTQGKYTAWVKDTRPGGGLCFTISWGRLTQLVEHDQTDMNLFVAMFANRLKENEFVERFYADVNGITVFIGEKD